MPNMEGVKCVLLDIEGTICPISFVKDTLFPYALKALPEVLSNRWDDEDFRTYRDAFPEDTRESRGKLQAHVEDLTERDVKVAYLKNLQGYLWEDGYKSGAYSTPLFDDVQPKLENWRDDGFVLAIYSSGSVFAQKLLFGHVKSTAEGGRRKRKRSAEADGRLEDGTPGLPLKKRINSTENTEPRDTANESHAESENGGEPTSQVLEAPEVESTTDRVIESESTEDLKPLITDWFDTTNAGLKTESTSYKKIAAALELPPGNIAFLSDNVKEVDAAAAAGMLSIMVDRPGNAPLSDADRDRLKVVNSLEEVELRSPSDSRKTISPTKEPDRRQSSRLKAKASSSS